MLTSFVFHVNGFFNIPHEGFSLSSTGVFPINMDLKSLIHHSSAFYIVMFLSCDDRHCVPLADFKQLVLTVLEYFVEKQIIDFFHRKIKG